MAAYTLHQGTTLKLYIRQPLWPLYRLPATEEQEHAECVGSATSRSIGDILSRSRLLIWFCDTSLYWNGLNLLAPTPGAVPGARLLVIDEDSGTLLVVCSAQMLQQVPVLRVDSTGER